MGPSDRRCYRVCPRLSSEWSPAEYEYVHCLIVVVSLWLWLWRRTHFTRCDIRGVLDRGGADMYPFLLKARPEGVMLLLAAPEHAFPAFAILEAVKQRNCKVTEAN